MKKVRIASYQIGLVFKEKELVGLLKAGAYWIFGNKQIEILPKSVAISSKVLPLDLLLKFDPLAALLDKISVRDGEIVLLFEAGIFQEVLPTGQYAYWKEDKDRAFLSVDLTDIYIDRSISRAVLDNPKLRAFVRKLVVANQHKGLLFVEGKLDKILDAGTYYFWNNATSIEVKSIDTRMQQLEVAGQELLSKDKATLRINFYIRYEVTDLVRAVMGNREYDKQLYVLVQLALRAFIGGMTLDELLSRKTEVGPEILSYLSDQVTALGVSVVDAGIRDVILTGDMKEIMSQVIIAEKKAQANSIMRREETAATRSMLNTAKMMEENALLLKLKEMEYVERIADKIGSLSLTGNSNMIGQLKEIFLK
ncbi:slipin family protein [Arachidicoccus ginsenosidivorans]|nr:slipin family protein [Arachidicoccus ginsenosidivorans]